MFQLLLKINFHCVTKENKINIIEIGHKFPIINTEQIIGGSGSGKANALLNLINHKQYSDKIYL